MVKVGYIQMEPKILELDKNYSKAEKLIKEASKEGAKLVVLPELFDTGYNFESRARPLHSRRDSREIWKLFV